MARTKTGKYHYLALCIMGVGKTLIDFSAWPRERFHLAVAMADSYNAVLGMHVFVRVYYADHTSKRLTVAGTRRALRADGVSLPER